MASNLLAIDYGASRVGLALADTELKIARPLATLINNANLVDELKKVVSDNSVSQLVVGLPRNLDGDDTPQTAKARQFASELERALKLPVYLIDEAATSIDAEAKLKQSGKPYDKADIDSLAAALILDNFLSNDDAK